MPLGYKQMRGVLERRGGLVGGPSLREIGLVWARGSLRGAFGDIAWENVFYVSNSTIEYDNQCVSHTRIYLIIKVKHEKTNKKLNMSIVKLSNIRESITLKVKPSATHFHLLHLQEIKHY